MILYEKQILILLFIYILMLLFYAWVEMIKFINYDHDMVETTKSNRSDGCGTEGTLNIAFKIPW